MATALCDQDVRLNFNVSGVYELPDYSAPGTLGRPRMADQYDLYRAQRSSVQRVQERGQRSFRPRSDRDEHSRQLYAEIPSSLTDSRITGTMSRNSFRQFRSDGTVGNTPRNFLIGPGLSQWDMTLAKNTKINERLNVQLRWEVYNVLNRGKLLPLQPGQRNSTARPSASLRKLRTWRQEILSLPRAGLAT